MVEISGRQATAPTTETAEESSAWPPSPGATMQELGNRGGSVPSDDKAVALSCTYSIRETTVE